MQNNMADYTGISRSHWDEPEYETAAEQNLAAYFIVNSDMVGVCPCHLRTVAGKTRISIRLLKKVIHKFSTSDCLKLVLATNSTHVWWRSKTFHSLYKGRYSPTQLKNCQKILCKWHETKIFGDFFFFEVAQLYAVKYNLVIPYPKKFDTLSDQSYIHSYIHPYVHSYIQSSGDDNQDNQDGFKKTKMNKINQKEKIFRDRLLKLDHKFKTTKMTELEYHQNLIALYVEFNKAVPKILNESLERLQGQFKKGKSKGVK